MRTSAPSAPTRYYPRPSPTAGIAFLERCKAVPPPLSAARCSGTSLLRLPVIPPQSPANFLSRQGIQSIGRQGIYQPFRTSAIFCPRPRSHVIRTGKSCIICQCEVPSYHSASGHDNERKQALTIGLQLTGYRPRVTVALSSCPNVLLSRGDTFAHGGEAEIWIRSSKGSNILVQSPQSGAKPTHQPFAQLQLLFFWPGHRCYRTDPAICRRFTFPGRYFSCRGRQPPPPDTSLSMFGTDPPWMSPCRGRRRSAGVYVAPAAKSNRCSNGARRTAAQVL